MYLIRNTLYTVVTFAVVFCIGISGLSFNASEDSVSPPPELSIDPDLLQSGDLIFRRGDSFASRVVLTVDKTSYYSHVGIIYMSEEGPMVVHAAPGDHLNEAEPVKAEPLSTFISSQYADAVTVRRYKDAQSADQASLVAYSYVQDSILFDAEFDLESTDKMYCTELVWRAYQALDIDLVDAAFDKLSLPFGSGMFILPGSLLKSPQLEEVLTTTHEQVYRYDSL